MTELDLQLISVLLILIINEKIYGNFIEKSNNQQYISVDYKKIEDYFKRLAANPKIYNCFLNIFSFNFSAPSNCCFSTEDDEDKYGDDSKQRSSARSVRDIFKFSLHHHVRA
jgi:hypothetical protein